MEQVETLLRLSDSLEKHTIAVRRMIHQKPELAFEDIRQQGWLCRSFGGWEYHMRRVRWSRESWR